MPDGGFNYYLEPDKIREYKKLTPEQKLQWLEEIFLFTQAALSIKVRQIRQMLRDGNPDQSQSDRSGF